MMSLTRASGTTHINRPLYVVRHTDCSQIQTGNIVTVDLLRSPSLTHTYQNKYNLGSSVFWATFCSLVISHVLSRLLLESCLDQTSHVLWSFNALQRLIQPPSLVSLPLTTRQNFMSTVLPRSDTSYFKCRRLIESVFETLQG